MSSVLTRTSTAPVFEGDFWSDEVILNPYPYYQQLRDLGPVVWLAQHNAYAITQYSALRDALLNGEVFSSAEGCMMNEPTNNMAKGIMLCTDDPKHMEMRKVFARPLMPGSLAPLKARLTELAEARINTLITQGRFDAVTELAHFLPLTVVTEMVGFSEEGKPHMLHWAAGIFNAFGPDTHARTLSGMEIMMEAFTYLQSVSRDDLDPNGWGAALFRAADDGKLTHQAAQAMLMDYLAPALDTTINATTALVELLCRNPDQWEKLRARPELIAGAIEEAIRLESPIRGFSRYATRAHQIGDVTIPQGARVMMLYACANRDKRKYPDPTRFDIERKNRDHLGFGYGSHVCAGMHLAKLEITTLLEILTRRVSNWTLIETERTAHNTLRGVARMIVDVAEAGVE